MTTRPSSAFQTPCATLLPLPLPQPPLSALPRSYTAPVCSPPSSLQFHGLLHPCRPRGGHYEAGRRQSFLRGEPARVKTGPGLGACASPDRRPPAPQSHPPAPRLRDAVAPFQRGPGAEPVIKCAGPARAKLTRHSPPASRRRPPGARAEPRGSSPDALSRGGPAPRGPGVF